jgi:hypothetical protein
MSPEILIDSALLAVTGLVLVAVTHRTDVVRRARHALRGMAWALVVSLPFAVYPIAVFLAGPEPYTGSPWDGTTYAEDLLGTIIPSLNQRITTTGLASFGDRLLPDLAENGAYLGIPMVIILVVLAVRRTGGDPEDVRSLHHRYGVQTVIVGPGGVDPDAAIALFTEALGPSEIVGGARIWLDLHCTGPTGDC